LDQRFSSNLIPASTDPVFDFTISFEIPSHLDPTSLLTAATPLIVILQRQKMEERPVILSTERIDWRDLLANNSVEITKEMQPIDLKHKGSLGILYIDLDIHPYISKDKLLNTATVRKQQELEKKFEAESHQQFLDYAKEWYSDFKEIRASHSKRLVKMFAETDDRSSIYTPT
jgi:centrosomal protein CEP76